MSMYLFNIFNESNTDTDHITTTLTPSGTNPQIFFQTNKMLIFKNSKNL